MEQRDKQAVAGERERERDQTSQVNNIYKCLTLLQINSVNTGSDSPMYSVIFLLIHGPTRFSISVCSNKYSDHMTHPHRHGTSPGLSVPT